MTTPQRPRLTFVAASVVATLTPGLVFVGCASTPVNHSGDLQQALLSTGLDPDQMVLPNRVNEQMTAWLERKMNQHNSPYETLQQLVRELRYPNDLKLVYEPGYTGTAEEVFATGEFNCLSFTHLFVAMARELGIDAYYLTVADLESYRREGDLVVRTTHITAGYKDGPNQRVLEYTVGPEVDYRWTKPISDARAVALYYSNRGAELMLEDQLPESIKHLSIATRLAPDLADIWINLGVAKRRAGDLDGAEQAYVKAVEVDSDAVAGYLNLTSLYRMRGEPEAAKKMFRMLHQQGTRNPFVFLALGDNSFENGQMDAAGNFYRKALSLSDERAEARAALGLWALASGDPAKARKLLERAQEEDATNARVVRLADKLGVTDSGT